MGAETRAITADVPIDLADKVEAMAGRLERTHGWVIKQALAAWVDLENERHQIRHCRENRSFGPSDD